MELESTPKHQVVHTLEYRPLNQSITMHVAPEICNNYLDDVHALLEMHFSWPKISIVPHMKN